MMKINYLLFTSFILLFQFAEAQECSEITTLEWLIEEVTNTHPKLLYQRLTLDQTMSKEYDAKKIINPELEHFSVWGKEFEPKQVYMNETRLWFTLQLAGKRSGRIKEWEQSLGVVKYEEELLKQAVLKDVWINFFRLHQIHEEINLKIKISSKLKQILSRYKTRRALSPDQTIEKKIIMMAEDNFLLSANMLEKEKSNIFQLFSEVTGYKCPIRKIAFEENQINWPSPDNILNTNQTELILSKKASLYANYLKTKAELADKKGTPDIRIAPLVQNYKSGSIDAYTYGVSFVFPLAFFDRNQTERISQKLEFGWAEKQIELASKKEIELLNFKISKYQTSMGVLKKVELINENEKEISSLNEWFSSGRLTLSNIVEFCRQIDDTSRSYHEGEQLLMNYLLDIFELQGRINPEHLLSLIKEDK